MEGGGAIFNMFRNNQTLIPTRDFINENPTNVLYFPSNRPIIPIETKQNGKRSEQKHTSYSSWEDPQQPKRIQYFQTRSNQSLDEKAKRTKSKSPTKTSPRPKSFTKAFSVDKGFVMVRFPLYQPIVFSYSRNLIKAKIKEYRAHTGFLFPRVSLTFSTFAPVFPYPPLDQSIDPDQWSCKVKYFDNETSLRHRFYYPFLEKSFSSQMYSQCMYYLQNDVSTHNKIARFSNESEFHKLFHHIRNLIKNLQGVSLSKNTSNEYVNYPRQPSSYIDKALSNEFLNDMVWLLAIHHKDVCQASSQEEFRFRRSSHKYHLNTYGADQNMSILLNRFFGALSFQGLFVFALEFIPLEEL